VTEAFHIRGDYFESCNCTAICPCRLIGGVPGGRSTYGVCFGLLSSLEHIFLDGLTQLPWIRKVRHIVGVKASTIEIDGTHVRVGTAAAADATRLVEDDCPVRCGIPGYEREGRELYADELRVWDEVLSGNCAYAGAFDYESG
jgi:hypothetical protein